MTTIAIKVDDSMDAYLRHQAAGQKKTVSEIIRAAINSQREHKRSRIGGRPGRALVNMPADTPKITNADLDEAAEDY